ncbi:MAG: serine/threonine-protein kinase PknK, partial [Deltaproteobacteria bacterium]|nr:serine/threonine-protein kinase PknK [Deltaproteobacteria bacterium]
MQAQVAGRYQLLREIGRGQSRVVFAARDTSLARDVAFKTLREGSRRDALAREFALLYRLDQPHLPRVYDIGVLAGEIEGSPHGAPFLVEELCEGVSAALWAAGKNAAPIAWLGAQVAAALAALHAHGVCHRDVKPEHIVLVGDPPGVKLVDFDLAVLAGADTVSGTLRYMAPEALAGRAGAASDIYSLAATLVELVTGAPPARHHGAQLWCEPLGDAVAAMSHPDPERRATAAQAFEMLAAQCSPADRHSLTALKDRSSLAAGLHGRERQLALIDEMLDPGRRGSRVLRMSGPPGMGKTALLREAVARAVARGFAVPGLVRPA